MLPSDAKERYLTKIKQLFTLGGKCSFPGIEATALPQANDPVSHLVLQTSFVTAKQFKGHTSLWKPITSLPVVGFKILVGKTVVTGKVNVLISQGSHNFSWIIPNSATQLSCWLIQESTGEVCCAHCICIVGLGKCAHIRTALLCSTWNSFKSKWGFIKHTAAMSMSCAFL